MRRSIERYENATAAPHASASVFMPSSSRKMAAVYMLAIPLRSRGHHPPSRGLGRTLLKELGQTFGFLMRQLGQAQARILLFLTYFLLVPPLSLLVRLAGDPLRVRARYASGSNWRPVERTRYLLSDLRRQF